MAIEIKVPSVGESISEVFIGEWYVSEGGWVDADANIVGLETDKATFDVPAPKAGQVTQILKEAGDTAAIGDVIAHLEPGENPNKPDGDEAPPGLPRSLPPHRLLPPHRRHRHRHRAGRV